MADSEKLYSTTKILSRLEKEKYFWTAMKFLMP